MKLLLCCVGLAIASARALPPVPKYETKYFPQVLDHFPSEAPTTTTPSPKWKQRYLIADEHWGAKGALPNGCKGPILFYSGNEGPIDAFWGLSGFMTQVLAPSMGALLIFGEARYYGLSQPQPSSSASEKRRFDFLSTEQILADYAGLLTSVKASLEGAGNCPVVSFGGSYGGTLTTLFRVKYPHVTVGGLAASAPIGYYAPSGWAARGVTQTTWFNTVVRDYSTAPTDPPINCYDTLVEAVAATRKFASAGLELKSAFHLCEDPAEDVDAFIYWVTEALESIPQLDYPDANGALPGAKRVYEMRVYEECAVGCVCVCVCVCVCW